MISFPYSFVNRPLNPYGTVSSATVTLPQTCWRCSGRCHTLGRPFPAVRRDRAYTFGEHWEQRNTATAAAGRVETAFAPAMTPVLRRLESVPVGRVRFVAMNCFRRVRCFAKWIDTFFSGFSYPVNRSQHLP